MTMSVGRPSRWRTARRGEPAAPSRRTDPVVMAGLTAIIFGCIFLQRLAVPVGAIQLSLSFLVGYGGLAYLMMRGRIVLSFPLCILFFVVMAALTMSILHSGSSASLMSFFYLFSIYSLYLFKVRGDGQAAAEDIRELYQRFMLVAAAGGIAQFCLQFVLPQELLFPLETFVPLPFKFGEIYNVIIPLTYGSPIFKSNGIIFLEPSFFSQFLALAFILELSGRQRASRLGLLAGGLLVAYSGTGLLLIALFLPYLMLRRGNLYLLLFAIAGVIILAFSATALNLDTFLGRVGEFNSPESSGFARFVSPFYLFRDFMETPSAFLLGLGPGSIDEVMKQASYRGYVSHDPTWIKAVLEYGVVAGLLLLGYVVAAFFAGSRDKVFSGVLLCLFLFMGGYLLNPIMHFLFASLLVWSNAETAMPQRIARRAGMSKRRPWLST